MMEPPKIPGRFICRLWCVVYDLEPSIFGVPKCLARGPLRIASEAIKVTAISESKKVVDLHEDWSLLLSRDLDLAPIAWLASCNQADSLSYPSCNDLLASRDRSTKIDLLPKRFYSASVTQTHFGVKDCSVLSVPNGRFLFLIQLEGMTMCVVLVQCHCRESIDEVGFGFDLRAGEDGSRAEVGAGTL